MTIEEQTQPGELTYEQEQDLNERELRAVRNFNDYNHGVPIPEILRSRKLSRAQFYRDLKIAAKLWDFDPEAIRHRALFNVSEYMYVNMTRYEEAREAAVKAQQELDAATTPEARKAVITKIKVARKDEYFYWSAMGKVVRISIEAAKLVMPKP